MNAHDLAGVLDQMAERQRYNEILLLIDTCQASTMYEHVTAPHVFAMSSSVRGESSYSYHVDEEIGVPVLDRFTWSLLQYMAKHNVTDATESGTGNGEGAALSIQDLFDSFDAKFLSSHPHMQVTPGTRSPKHVSLASLVLALPRPLVPSMGASESLQLGGAHTIARVPYDDGGRPKSPTFLETSTASTSPERIR